MERGEKLGYQRDFELLPSALFTNRDFHPALLAHISLWDAIASLPDYLQSITNQENDIQGEIDERTQLIGKGIIIEKGARVEGALIRGPIIIEAGAYIGHAALVRENTIIGRGCTIGHCTEIRQSILFPGVRAAHFNFIGDSIIGTDVFMGGGTIVSNNEFKGMGNPKHGITISNEGSRSESGLQKLGSIIGDQAKIGTHCTLMPGAVIRKGAAVYPGTIVKKGFFPKHNLQSQIEDMQKSFEENSNEQRS